MVNWRPIRMNGKLSKGYQQKSMKELVAEAMEQYKDWVMLLMTCPNGCVGQPPWACLAKPLPDGYYEFEGDEDTCDVCCTVGTILASSLDKRGGRGEWMLKRRSMLRRLSWIWL
jgi:hypothetical protein